MAGIEPLTEEEYEQAAPENAKAALEDETVRLMYDLYRKLCDLAEEMHSSYYDEDDDARAERHDTEDALLKRGCDWLEAKGVPIPWYWSDL